jgi:glycosyltransferase involved in cell wall biosynthesis
VKIAIADTTLAKSLIGGAQTFLSHLATGLVARGTQVHLVSAGVPNAKVSDALHQSGARVHTGLWPPRTLVEDAAPIFARWLNQLKPDVYLVSVSPDVGWAVLPYLQPGIAAIAIAHSDSDTFYRPFRHYGALLQQGIGVSPVICAQFIEQCGLTAEQVAWIPYGVVAGPEPSEDREAATSAPLRIAYVSRLEEPQKRASDLIRIVERLREVELDYELDVIGDGPLMNRFRSALMPEITNGRVRLHGWLQPTEVLNRLRRSEIFLLTSAFEGFSIALTEAMAHGLTPVVTDIPSGNRQLVRHGENGLLVSVGDIEGFVSTLRRLAAERALLQKLRHQAWHIGQLYTLPRMIDAYLDCFAQASKRANVAGRRPQPGFPLMESCRSRYPLWLRRIKVAAQRATQTGIL